MNHKEEVIKLLDQLERATGKICQAKIIIGRKTHRIGYLKDRALQVRDASPSFLSLNGTWKNLNEIHQAIQIQKIHELVKVGWVPIDAKDQRVKVKIDGIWKYLECPMCKKFDLNGVKSELPKQFECKYCKHSQCGPYYDVWASLEIDLQKAPYKIVRKVNKNFNEEAEDHGRGAGALAYPTTYADKTGEQKIAIAYIDIMPVNEVIAGFREPLKTPREPVFNPPPEMDTRLAESPRFLMPIRKPFDPAKVGGVYMLPVAREVTYTTPVATHDTVLKPILKKPTEEKDILKKHEEKDDHRQIADPGIPPVVIPPRPKYIAPSLRKPDIEKLLHVAYTTSGDRMPDPPSNPDYEKQEKPTQSQPKQEKESQPKQEKQEKPRQSPPKSIRKVGFNVGDNISLADAKVIDKINIPYSNTKITQTEPTKITQTEPTKITQTEPTKITQTEPKKAKELGKSTVKQKINQWNAIAETEGKNTVFRKKEEKKPGLMGLWK